jgi:para-nitrobenzyl esterase
LEVVVGFTSYEMGLYLLYDPDLDRKPYAQQLASLRTDESVKRSLIELYDAAYPHEPQGVRGMHMLSDIWFVMPSLLFAEHLARTGRNVWVYEFAWHNPGSRLRAGHALDLCFWFDKTSIKQSRFLLGEPTGAADQQSRDALARHMQDALIQFARTGSPAAADPGATPWPAYNQVDRPVCVFDRQCAVVNDPRRVTRQWWLEHQSLIWDPAHAALRD